MELIVRSKDTEYRDKVFDQLFDDVLTLEDPSVAVVRRDEAAKRLPEEKGDPVTLASIAIVAVGAGGALTAAFGPGGFFTKLASVLESYCNREVEICVKRGEDETRLKGSAKDIKAILDDIARD